MLERRHNIINRDGRRTVDNSDPKIELRLI